MRQIAALAATLLVAGTTMAQAVSGLYTLQGTNPDGSTYVGEVEIVPLSEVTCEITWATGGEVSTGICMRYDNAFAAAYTMDADVGLLIYQIMPNGTMQGTWTIAGQDGVGNEMLIPK
jgi:hypothetical protein